MYDNSININMQCLLPFITSDESDFEFSSGQFFTFGPTVTSHSFIIDIVDDNIFEDKYEIFSISLSTNATELCGLQFGNASLIISDDDSKLSVFQSV